MTRGLPSRGLTTIDLTTRCLVWLIYSIASWILVNIPYSLDSWPHYTHIQKRWSIKVENKNALSSVQSRLLGDEFCCQRPRCVILLFRLEYKTSVECHNVYTQKVTIARRDRPHILASNRCETFENLLHIDIAPLRSTLSGILHSKNWTMIFIGIMGPWLCQYKYT